MYHIMHQSYLSVAEKREEKEEREKTSNVMQPPEF